MPIDIAILATTVVTNFLLPFAKIGAEKIGEIATKKVSQISGEHAEGLANRVWSLVAKIFSSKEEKVTLEQFLKRPDAAKSLIEDILKEKIEKDSKLAQELDTLVNTESPDGKGTGAQIMKAVIAGIVDLRGAHIEGSGHVIAGVHNTSTRPPRTSNENQTQK